MNEQELKELQEELDEKKYRQSEIAQLDLGGNMDFCHNCAFKRKNAENDLFHCNLDRFSVVINQVCAKNYLRNKEANGFKQQKPTTRKRNTKNS